MPPFGKPTPGLFDDPGIDDPGIADPGIADPGNADPGIASALGDDLSWTDLGVAELGLLASSLVTDPRIAAARCARNRHAGDHDAGRPANRAGLTDGVHDQDQLGCGALLSAPAGFTSDVLAAVNFLETQFISPITITINIGYEEIARQRVGQQRSGRKPRRTWPPSATRICSARSVRAHRQRSRCERCRVIAAFTTNPVSGSTDWVTTAQAKALGIPSSALGDVDLGAADGSIGFGAASEFTYGLTNGGGTVAPKTYDFFATALHEMTEVMGRQLLTGTAEDGLRNKVTLCWICCTTPDQASTISRNSRQGISR